MVDRDGRRSRARLHQSRDVRAEDRSEDDLTHVTRGRWTSVTAESPRVLVVEDDDDLRGLLRAALADAGYVAVEAADGAAALAVCAEGDPDVILLDLALPGLDGQAFADSYRRGLGRAKIIVTSGATRGGEESARMGAAVFLSKPFGVAEVLSAVKRVLRPAIA
jgi:DNA-binding response OmpR family regulator